MICCARGITGLGELVGHLLVELILHFAAPAHGSSAASGVPPLTVFCAFSRQLVLRIALVIYLEEFLVEGRHPVRGA